MLSVPCGPELISIIRLSFEAKVPLMLHGPHGVGKSEIFEQTARSLGIGIVVCDLSLMEAPDLVGLPRFEGGRTVFAPPIFLPSEGRGLLLFEEINRAPRYMQAPTLQLLTTRRLNSYQLPAGWLPCAAINDAADGYIADELDAALLSRWLHVEVTPDVDAWTTWAAGAGVHPCVRDFVASCPDVFDDPASNPRAWANAAKLVATWERGPKLEAMLAVALAGVLGDRWGNAFLRFYLGKDRPLSAIDIIDDYDAHRGVLRGWVSQRKLDLVRASLVALQRTLQAHKTYAAVVADGKKKQHVEGFIADLPAELRAQAAAWVEERGFDALDIGQRKCRKQSA